MRGVYAICLGALLAVSLGAAAQTMYRWVDKEGKVHYSDQPPPREVRKVDQPRLGISSIETSGPSYGARQAARDFPVTLYTAKDCAAECASARDFLARRGVPYREQALATPDDAAAFKKTFGTDKLFLPSVSVGSQKSQGFEEGAWGGLLDAAGYPRGASPGGAARSAPAPAAR